MIIRGSFLAWTPKHQRVRGTKESITQLVLIIHDRRPNTSDTGLLPNTSRRAGQFQEMVESKKKKTKQDQAKMCP